MSDNEPMHDIGKETNPTERERIAQGNCWLSREGILTLQSEDVIPSLLGRTAFDAGWRAAIEYTLHRLKEPNDPEVLARIV